MPAQVSFLQLNATGGGCTSWCCQSLCTSENIIARSLISGCKALTGLSFASLKSLAYYSIDESIPPHHWAAYKQGVGARCLGTHMHYPVSPHAKSNGMQSGVECENCPVFSLYSRNMRKDASFENCFLGSFEDPGAMSPCTWPP